MKKSSGLLISGILLLSLFLAPNLAYAGKKVNSNKKVSKNANVLVYPSVNRYKNAVLVYFKNLHKTNSVSYILSYNTNGKPDGASGTINTKGKFSLSRTLLLGTCSSGVCRYHKNITGLTLTVTANYKNGSTSTITYKIRI